MLISPAGCVVLVAAVGRCGVLARLRSRGARETNARSMHGSSGRSSRCPPRYSASVNCQPISTQRTSPSSQTRFVEANWKASAVAAEAPFWKRLLAIAIAA